MAITWKWEEKCGEATFRREDGYTYNVDLYVGNCFLIMIHEFKENGVDRYTLSSFFVDDSHMERCLKDNIFTGYDRLTSITINKAKCRNYKKIVELLATYMDDIDISVYKDGEQTWTEWKHAEPVIPDERMRELAESAISYLNDEDMLREFAEDRYIDFTEEEKSYFGIYDWENDEDEMQ